MKMQTNDLLLLGIMVNVTHFLQHDNQTESLIFLAVTADKTIQIAYSLHCIRQKSKPQKILNRNSKSQLHINKIMCTRFWIYFLKKHKISLENILRQRSY